MTINANEYWKEIAALADQIATEAMQDVENDREAAEDAINDHILHETIDGHQWVIYNNYNMDVMNHSENMDYYIDNFGAEDAGCVLKERGIYGLHNVIAFWCMYADVQEKIGAALDTIEENAAE